LAAAAADAQKAFGPGGDHDLWPLAMAGIVLFGAFMSWIKAVLGAATAILIRRPVPGAVAAACVGAGEFLLMTGEPLLSKGFILPEIDASVATTVLLSALAGVAWWGIARALYAMTPFGKALAAAGTTER
jgi:hypothetical protein